MRAFLFVLALAAATPADRAGEVTVSVTPGRIALAATAAPVSDVLDQLARKTGMKVVYEGAPPRLLVSPHLERETVGQAVLALLEGLGLTYVLTSDPAVGQVETLFIASGVGAAGTAPPGSPPAAAPRPASTDPPEKRRPMPDDDQEEDIAPPTPQMPPVQQPQEVEPPRTVPTPAPTFPGSPFGPPGPPQPVVIPVPAQPFIPGLTPPTAPPTPATPPPQ